MEIHTKILQPIVLEINDKNINLIFLFEWSRIADLLAYSNAWKFKT